MYYDRWVWIHYNSISGIWYLLVFTTFSYVVVFFNNSARFSIVLNWRTFLVIICGEMNANFFSSPSGRQLCCTLHTLQQLTCPQKKRVNFNGFKLSIKLLNIVNHCFEQHTFVSCGSRISRWGAPTSDVYAFQRKCMQKQKNWILLGGRALAAPPGSANVCLEFFIVIYRWHISNRTQYQWNVGKTLNPFRLGLPDRNRERKFVPMERHHSTGNYIH